MNLVPVILSRLVCNPYNLLDGAQTHRKHLLYSVFQIHAPGHKTIANSALPATGGRERRRCGPSGRSSRSSVRGTATDRRQSAGVCRDDVFAAWTRHSGITSLQ